MWAERACLNGSVWYGVVGMTGGQTMKTTMTVWQLPVAQKLAGMLAGCSRQVAQQQVRHGYLKWLRAHYRREVAAGASKYAGRTLSERHGAYVASVRESLLAEVPVGGKRRGRPRVTSKWGPVSLAKVLCVGVESGDTLVTVFERWAASELARLLKLVQTAKEKAAAAGKPLKKVVHAFLNAVYPPWARASVGWGSHLYGSGYREAQDAQVFASLGL